MKLYHRTSAANADAILAEGFRDGKRTYLADREWEGVWLCSRDGFAEWGEVLLVVTLDARRIKQHELPETAETYREWCVPAAWLNEQRRTGLATVELGGNDDDDEVLPLPPESTPGAHSTVEAGGTHHAAAR